MCSIAGFPDAAAPPCSAASSTCAAFRSAVLSSRPHMHPSAPTMPPRQCAPAPSPRSCQTGRRVGTAASAAPESIRTAAPASSLDWVLTRMDNSFKKTPAHDHFDAPGARGRTRYRSLPLAPDWRHRVPASASGRCRSGRSRCSLLHPHAIATGRYCALIHAGCRCGRR